MASRPSSYAAPHKGLRHCFADVLLLAGRTDPADRSEVEALLNKVRLLFRLLELHAGDENAVFLERLDQRAPGAGTHDRSDHDRLEALQAELDHLLHHIAEAPTAGILDRLYDGLQLLFAEHLHHMREEEEATQQLLYDHFTDAELDDMRAAILQRLGPDNCLLWFEQIFPALRPQEARQMLGGVMASPDKAFAERARSVIRSAVGEERWNAINVVGNVPV